MQKQTKNHSLTTKQRTLFDLIVQLTFVNPFDKQRLYLETKIIGSSIDKLDHNQKRTSIFNTLSESYSSIKLLKLSEFETKDQFLIKHVFLFFQYHKYTDNIDKLIAKQLEHPSQNIAAPFTIEIIKDFQAFGLNSSEAAHYISLFFQIRRAFYFIFTNIRFIYIYGRKIVS